MNNYDDLTPRREYMAVRVLSSQGNITYPANDFLAQKVADLLAEHVDQAISRAALAGLTQTAAYTPDQPSLSVRELADAVLKVSLTVHYLTVAAIPQGKFAWKQLEDQRGYLVLINPLDEARFIEEMRQVATRVIKYELPRK